MVFIAAAVLTEKANEAGLRPKEEEETGKRGKRKRTRPQKGSQAKDAASLARKLKRVFSSEQPLLVLLLQPRPPCVPPSLLPAGRVWKYRAGSDAAS